jgi:hypothetical protein
MSRSGAAQILAPPPTGGGRRRIVATAFAALAAADHPVPTEVIGDALADAYNALHDEELSLFPDAHETLDRLKELGIKLALITNGAAEPQRAKVVRFALEHRFDHIQIEAEHGFGKPEERAYNHAMEVLGVGPDETWMIGDNLEWKSWHPNGSAFTRSGTTVTASGCPATPRSGPTASSAACRNCCCSRAYWFASRAVALVWLMTGTAASAQTGLGVGHDRAALTQAICRQYAAAQRAMPYDTMYAQCMYARATECRVSRRRPIPLVIKASCRVPRLIMEVPERAECERAEQPSARSKPATIRPSAIP